MVFGRTGWVSKMLSVFSSGGTRTSRFKFQLLLPILYTNICVCICLSHICMYLWHLLAEYLQLFPGTTESNDKKPYCFSINYCGIYTKELSKNCSKLIFFMAMQNNSNYSIYCVTQWLLSKGICCIS